jgi:hypothetical protein
VAFSSDDISASRDYFLHKLRAEKERNDVLKEVEANQFDFVLLDTGGRIHSPMGIFQVHGVCPPRKWTKSLRGYQKM